VSTNRTAIEPSSDVNEFRAMRQIEPTESPGRGERLDGTDEVPDRQLRIRQV
jgi:hypothetical protein